MRGAAVIAGKGAARNPEARTAEGPNIRECPLLAGARSLTGFAPTTHTRTLTRRELNALCYGVPRDGSIILSDVRGPTLSIVCQPCGRRDRYSVQRLMAQHGDPKLTDLLETLANCPKARSASIHDRCKAVYSDLYLDEG
jgi:hypothetical protein